jgi:hypothetical protein
MLNFGGYPVSLPNLEPDRSNCESRRSSLEPDLPNPESGNECLLTICEHIKPGGERCGSAALHGSKYCYHHTDVRKRVPKTNLFVRLWNPGHERDPNFAYDLPYLEDPEAVQIGFTQLIHGVAQELISPQRAKLILSALHGAALNLRLIQKTVAQSERAIAPRKQPASSKSE